MDEAKFFELVVAAGLEAVKGEKGYTLDRPGVTHSFNSAYLTNYGLTATSEWDMIQWLKQTANVCGVKNV